MAQNDSTPPGTCRINWFGVASVIHYDDVSFLMDEDRYVGGVDINVNFSQFPAVDVMCHLEVDLIVTPHSFRVVSTYTNMEVIPSWKPVYDSRPNLLLAVLLAVWNHVEPTVPAPSQLVARKKYDKRGSNDTE